MIVFEPAYFSQHFIQVCPLHENDFYRSTTLWCLSLVCRELSIIKTVDSKVQQLTSIDMSWAENMQVTPLLSTLASQPSPLNPRPPTLDPRPSTLDPRPQILNPPPSAMPSSSLFSPPKRCRVQVLKCHLMPRPPSLKLRYALEVMQMVIRIGSLDPPP